MAPLDFVLPEVAVRALELMPVCTATVAPQRVSALVKAVNEAIGQPAELQHLKRVRPRAAGSAAGAGGGSRPQGRPEALEVLLWPGGPDELQRLPAALATALAKFDLQLSHSAVPRHAPATRAQFEAWSKVWPLVFHPTAAVHALAPWTPDTEPLPDELEWMATQMRRAIALAERSVAAGGRPVGAVIARPLCRALAACADGTALGTAVGAGGSAGGPSAVGEGGGGRSMVPQTVAATAAAAADACATDEALLHHTTGGGQSTAGEGNRSTGGWLTGRHPLQHALMQCVACVAEAQRRRRDAAGGGLLGQRGVAGFKRGVAAITDEVEVAPGDSSAAARSSAGMASGSGAADDFAASSCDKQVDFGTSDSSKLDTEGDFEASSVEEQYLCSGCDVFVTVEPCAMCAMALVHSRIRRLVYALPAAEGALGSKYLIHTVPSLNHHFQVVRGFLGHEARERLGGDGAQLQRVKAG